MTIAKIYSVYRIPPTLQMHQYRVAGVAQIIAQNILGVDVDASEVIRACLLHDMGNIIKFNMKLFPEFFEPEGVAYWSNIKEEFIDKYGLDEHVATVEIAKEVIHYELKVQSAKLKFSRERILELIHAIGFSNARENFESDDFSAKIAAYADMRVEPHGVTSLENRLKDGNRRFNLNKPGTGRNDFFAGMSAYLRKIEVQIFEKSTLKPEDITEEAVQKMIPELKKTEL